MRAILPKPRSSRGHPKIPVTDCLTWTKHQVAEFEPDSSAVASNFFDAFVIANLGSIPPGITFNENFMLQPRMVRVALRFNF